MVVRRKRTTIKRSIFVNIKKNLIQKDSFLRYGHLPHHEARPHEVGNKLVLLNCDSVHEHKHNTRNRICHILRRINIPRRPSASFAGALTYWMSPMTRS